MSVSGMKEAILNGGDAMWAGRSVVLIDALEGTGIDFPEIESEALLEKMEAVRADFADVAAFLDTLPGYPEDRAVAVQQLEYLLLLPRKFLSDSNKH